MWSSQVKQSYTAITIDQFLWHEVSITGNKGTHTSDMIAESLQQILMKCILDPDKLLAMTTDNGSYIALALIKLDSH